MIWTRLRLVVDVGRGDDVACDSPCGATVIATAMLCGSLCHMRQAYGPSDEPWSWDVDHLVYPHPPPRGVCVISASHVILMYLTCTGRDGKFSNKSIKVVMTVLVMMTSSARINQQRAEIEGNSSNLSCIFCSRYILFAPTMQCFAKVLHPLKKGSTKRAESE